jgi:folylpolyglutamate synthase/dihydropteroate synthase
MNRREKNYSKAIEWLDSLNLNKIIPGLDRMTELMKHLNNPQNKLKIIMVGGTNAKGSTCHNLNYNLNKVGIKTGCYTSPHLHTIRERIQIGNKKISKDEFTKIIFELKRIDEEHNIGSTYFEILTALAYFYFNQKKIDYAIMEIGLGGEWDAVNIGNPKIAILTTLGIDHVDYLGKTIEEIATTKAKIVRKKSILVTGWGREYHKYIPKCESFDYSENMNNWIEIVFQKLKIKASIEIISMPGRFEKFKNFTLDIAHNEQAMEYLLKKDMKYKNIIIGILKDKNAIDMIKLLPQKTNLMACNLPTERGISSEKLGEMARNIGYDCSEYNNVKEAMKSAKDQKTLVTGSFYTVSEARYYLELKGHSEL